KGVVGMANHTALISRSGEEFHIADSAAPVLNEKGDISGTVLVFRDASEEYRQREEASHSVEYDCGKVTGISAGDAQGKSLVSVFPRMASEMDKIRETIRTRQPCCEERKTRQGESGTYYEDVTIFPLIANGVDGAVIQIDDVTERCNLEQMMIQSEKMMSVGGLAAGMAHEIN
ncbi:PAS domain S-box protein, partial [Aduncisulcus paluster]